MDGPLLKSQYVDAIFASAELVTFHRQLEINAGNKRMLISVSLFKSVTEIF